MTVKITFSKMRIEKLWKRGAAKKFQQNENTEEEAVNSRTDSPDDRFRRRKKKGGVSRRGLKPKREERSTLVGRRGEQQRRERGLVDELVTPRSSSFLFGRKVHPLRDNPPRGRNYRVSLRECASEVGREEAFRREHGRSGEALIRCLGILETGFEAAKYELSKLTTLCLAKKKYRNSLSLWKGTNQPLKEGKKEKARRKREEGRPSLKTEVEELKRKGTKGNKKKKNREEKEEWIKRRGKKEREEERRITLVTSPGVIKFRRTRKIACRGTGKKIQNEKGGKESEEEEGGGGMEANDVTSGACNGDRRVVLVPREIVAI